ncbi:nuclease, partial [Fistulina hepatica ATCC 64428]
LDPTLLAFLAGSLTTVSSVLIYRRYFRRIQNSDWVTPPMLEKRKWIRGVVTSVGDADNFRLYHTPAFGWGWPLKFRRVPQNAKELKDMTIHIRIAGIDAPEAAHFGREAQPYAAESLEFLQSKVLHQTVYCQLLRRDQYGRTVATVLLRPRLFLPASLVSGPSLALAMLKAGWAATYEQAGAEYGKSGKAAFLMAERQAKYSSFFSRDRRRGMWASGLDGETPAEYKRRHAAMESGRPGQTSTRKSRSTAGGKWYSFW